MKICFYFQLGRVCLLDPNKEGKNITEFNENSLKINRNIPVLNGRSHDNCPSNVYFAVAHNSQESFEPVDKLLAPVNIIHYMIIINIIYNLNVL